MHPHYCLQRRRDRSSKDSSSSHLYVSGTEVDFFVRDQRLRRERPRESLPTRLKRHGYSSDIFVPSSSPWKPQHPTSSTGLFPPQSLLFLGGSLTAASFFAVELWVYLLFSLDYNIITQQAQVWPCLVHENF